MRPKLRTHLKLEAAVRQMLQEMAQEDRRNESTQVEWLVIQEMVRRGKAIKPLPPAPPAPPEESHETSVG